MRKKAKRPKAPSSMRELTRSERMEYERMVSQNLALLQPHIDAASDCERLTWKDYAVRINVKN